MSDQLIDLALHGLLQEVDFKELVLSLLKKHQLFANKKYGQHFLVAGHVYRCLVEAMQIKPGAQIIEIGPGLGTLTTCLLAKGATVTALEKDPNMYHLLQKELGSHPRLNLILQDAVNYDFSSVYTGAYSIVGNLPYNVSTQILMGALSCTERLEKMVFMFQKEVADRISCLPGSKIYGGLSAKVQLLSTVKKICLVGPGSFYPPPKVESAVLGFMPYPRQISMESIYSTYFSIVDSAFMQRRKTIHNALKQLIKDEKIFLAAQVDASLRAENLSVDDFLRLSIALVNTR